MASTTNMAMFSKFLEQKSIIKTAVTVIISAKIFELSNTFLDTMILPIMYRDSSGDGKPDIKKLESKKFKFMGAEFQIGKFFIEFIKFVLILIIAFIMSRYS